MKACPQISDFSWILKEEHSSVFFHFLDLEKDSKI